MNALWLRFLPGFVRNRLDGRHGLQAVLGNSSWLFTDKILRMVVGLLVGIWVVRYLGPEQLGLLNYSGAFAGLFGVAATLGLDSIVIRELVKDPQRQRELIGTAFTLKLIGSVVALIGAAIVISFVRAGDTRMLWLVLLCSAGYLFQSINVIDFYFQAKVQSKFTVYATTGAFLLLTITKIVLLLSGASLFAFAWAGLGEVVLASAFLIIAYVKNHQRIQDWKYSGRLAREMLIQSWPLILAGLAVMIYMRIDQIMIGEMLGDREVGLFAAAVKISELWYFIPMAMASSLFPTIVKSKKLGDAIYYARLQKFFTVMAWMAIVVAVVVTLTRETIIAFLYGQAYAASATVLAIHIWAGVFVALGVASSGWYMVEHFQKYTFYRTLFGGVANVGLNLILIPKYGIEGSAIATVISQFLASFLFDLFNRDTREIFWMKVRTFNPLSAFSKAK